jgi:hypothetical protein
MRIQRRPEELDAPFCSEGVQGRPIQKAVSHRSGKFREEGRCIKGWSHEDILAGGRISHIDEAVRCVAGNADDVTRLGEDSELPIPGKVMRAGGAERRLAGFGRKSRRSPIHSSTTRPD